MTAAKMVDIKWRHGDARGAQFSQRLLQSRQIGGVGKDGEIGVAAKLGRAVKHAGLPAHEQGADAVRAHRRKDFAYRVRDQGILPARDRSAKVSRFPASVVRE
jgi:hypothetical protein